MIYAKTSTHPRFAHLPEIESFARTDKDRRLLEVNRAFRIAAATFITPPRTPPERIRTLRDAVTNAYNDPEFFKDYKKITGETPSPILPDEFDVIIKKLPRNPEDVDLYKKIAGTGPCPAINMTSGKLIITTSAHIRHSRERGNPASYLHPDHFRH